MGPELLSVLILILSHFSVLPHLLPPQFPRHTLSPLRASLSFSTTQGLITTGTLLPSSCFSVPVCLVLSQTTKPCPNWMCSKQGVWGFTDLLLRAQRRNHSCPVLFCQETREKAIDRIYTPFHSHYFPFLSLFLSHLSSTFHRIPHNSFP